MSTKSFGTRAQSSSGLPPLGSSFGLSPLGTVPRLGLSPKPLDTTGSISNPRPLSTKSFSPVPAASLGLARPIGLSPAPAVYTPVPIQERSVEVKKIIEAQTPVERVVEVERPVIIEKTVEVERPVIIEKTVEVERPVIIEKTVEAECPVIIEKPVLVEKLVNVNVEPPIVVTGPKAEISHKPEPTCGPMFLNSAASSLSITKFNADEIIGHGYHPLLYIKTATGTLVKCLTLHGRKVYINIGRQYIEGIQELRAQTQEEQLIPESMKHALYEHMDVNVSGMVVERDRVGVVVLSHDSDALPLVHNYRTSDHRISESSCKMYSFPLVNWGQIKEHPELVTQNIILVSDRIRSSLLLHSKESLTRCGGTVENLTNAIKKFDKLRVNALSQLKHTLESLYSHQEEALKMPVGAQRERYLGLIHYNLTRRNDDLEKLITLTQAVAEMTEKLNAQVHDLGQLTSLTEETFVDLDTVLIPPSK